jgi:hypothetical protein
MTTLKYQINNNKKIINQLNIGIMKLSESELEILKVNSLSINNAKNIGSQIDSDHTVGGIFPKGETGDFSDPDIEKFKSRWCSWWTVAKILLSLAKIFVGERTDKVLDAILSLGNRICVDQN